MANRSRKPKLAAKPSGLPVPLFLTAAFLLGVGTTWLVMRGTSQEPPKQVIESFLPPSSAGATAPPMSQVTPSAFVGPPDVSQLPVADAARTLGNWNYDRQDWSHAIEHYEQAIARGADNPDVRTDLGNCFRFLGQPQKALEQYQLAQKENPLHENSLFNQISLYADFLHDKERAAATARDFLARFPQSPQAEAARKRLEQK
ncbi:MAG TPA: tetratricopeptide repeat protein [Chthoniobacterales bacterium]|jgi:TolA-binding protein